MAKRPPTQNGSRPAPRSRRSPTYAGDRLPRELFADEELSQDHERRKHAPLQEEEQRERLELASLAKLNSEGESAVAVGSDGAALVVEGGKHKGEKVSFGTEGATLGRSSKSTLTLRMGAGVSRHHAKIAYVEDKGAFTITDLGSRNGTNVNGATITAPTFLRDRDLIEISAERIRFIGPSPAEQPDDVGGESMPPPGFGLDEPVPHSAMADVTAPSMAPAKKPRAKPAPDLPPPPTATPHTSPPTAPPEMAEPADLPPPLSPPPSPPLEDPRSPPEFSLEVPADHDVEPPAFATEAAPMETPPQSGVDLDPGALPPALPPAQTDVTSPPPKSSGGASAILFALGIFLGVVGIGAAFAIDAFVLDGLVAKSVLGIFGIGGDDETPAAPSIPEGPAIDVLAHGGGEVKSVRVSVGDVVKKADVVGTVARGGPEDPAAYQKLLAERTRLERLAKSKRKKTRRAAKTKLAKVATQIAASEAGPVKIYNIRSDQDGVVKELMMKVGDVLKPGSVILRVVGSTTAKATPPSDSVAPSQ